MPAGPAGPCSRARRNSGGRGTHEASDQDESPTLRGGEELTLCGLQEQGERESRTLWVCEVSPLQNTRGQLF